MKTTFSALKVWLVIIAVVVTSGCARRNDDNTGGSFGYPGYPGYPGGGGSYNCLPGQVCSGVGPGGLIASAAGMVNIPGDCNGNQTIDFEIFIRAGGAGGTTNATVDGQVRMLQSDCLCNIPLPGPSTMAIIPQQSLISLTGSGSRQNISGQLAVQGPFGIFFIAISQLQPAWIEARTNGPAIGRITGTQFPYVLKGNVQPGSCSAPSMTTDWTFDPL